MEERQERKAKRFLERAEQWFQTGSLEGAIRNVRKAEPLHPSLPGLRQSLAAYQVHAAAKKPRLSGSSYWHGILGSRPSDNVEAIKRQYKKMCVLVHPDKCRSAAANGAFKLVSEAFREISAAASATPLKPGSTTANTSFHSEKGSGGGGGHASCPQCKARVGFVGELSRLAIACRACDLIAVRKDETREEFPVVVKMRGGRFFKPGSSCSTAKADGSVYVSLRAHGMDVESFMATDPEAGTKFQITVARDGISVLFS